ncbi:hypothetical protein JYU34_014418 [Plutella xylostella]|uniref:ascorbate ferrireductase (transmembrane) n=1 Tax=Plutella xylostella TaxID=51655 RepID=A0ABQ7Q8N1_PLUXY|nr:hypothetical protein JYU34_014418 [Plutella xylostella]
MQSVPSASSLANVPTVTAVNQENGGVNPEGPPPSLLLLRTMHVVNTLTHLLLGAVIILGVLCGNYYSIIKGPLSAHIYLCVVGYVVLMSQAVLSLSPYNGWSQTFSYQEKRFMHWVLQIAGSALAITGSIIKIVDTPDNFQTVHGIIGLIALLLTCLSMIGGIINLLFFKVNPKIIKILHASLGLLTLCVAYLSLIFAFSDYSNIFLNGVSNVRLAISLTVVGLGGLVASSIVNIFQRIYS